MSYQTSQLPASIRKQVDDFIDFLMQKYKVSQAQKNTSRMSLFGMYEGKIRMSDDFDAPIDDFEGYM